MILETLVPETKALVLNMATIKQKLIFPYTGNMSTSKSRSVSALVQSWLLAHGMTQDTPDLATRINLYVKHHHSKYRKFDMVWQGNPHGMVSYTADLAGGCWNARNVWVFDLEKTYEEQKEQVYMWNRIPEEGKEKPAQ
ncbi:hypothetical protein VH22019_00050 [Vibrio phage VH2_2019]|nr:hypothetical protein VH22019_00050 [Vibrio phage VH2_2019]